ncbi:MAG TPA: PAS domain-containing protein, partial [Candidatus Wallbacteria bacterium]|nr:PAS domain-containing protein [Candidatus Wallbacteria bacterium]
MISKKVFIMNGIESEILKNISVAVYICDPEMNVTYVNSYCETLTGVSAKDAVNKKCYELFGSSHCSQMQECPFKKAVQTGQFVSTSKIYYKTGKGLVKRVQ